MPRADNVGIQVKGAEELKLKFELLNRSLSDYMARAAVDASKAVILKPRGGKDALYPPQTEANQPGRYSLKNHQRMGYYARGFGYYRPIAGGDYKLDKKSEKMGPSFTVVKVGYGAKVGTTASYAKYVIGDDQAKFHAAHGWKKLIDVATENIDKITRVFQVWVDKALKNTKLK